MKRSFLLPGILCLLSVETVWACESTVVYKLENSNGGVYANQTVTLTDLVDGKTYTGKSDAKGEAKVTVPCQRRFKVGISNYARSSEVKSGNESDKAYQTMSYAPNMKAMAAKMAMNEEQKKSMDDLANALPDSFTLASIQSIVNQHPTNFLKLVISLKDMHGQPLANEKFTFVGIKRNKRFKGVTGKAGGALVYLPKGDTYRLDFTYTPDFLTEDVEYSHSKTEMTMNYAYLGTEEILRRRREEAARIAAEEARLKKEKEEFLAWCKAKKVSPEEGMRLKLKEQVTGPDTVVLSVLARNKWKDKLIVCDLTGSMTPFAAQLSMWYQLMYKTEPNLQFVFFNDGDNKSDASKVIGKTGGIYYTPSKGIDSLARFMALVSSRGSGGDCPENNMEALIKSVQLAKPFKELVMIADNYAPVKDIVLLKEFKVPVHIILCGGLSGNICTDYLDIARKTGGSIHTIEQDILNLATLAEGEEINIQGTIYKVMGGKFIRLSKT